MQRYEGMAAADKIRVESEKEGASEGEKKEGKSVSSKKEKGTKKVRAKTCKCMLPSKLAPTFWSSGSKYSKICPTTADLIFANDRRTMRIFTSNVWIKGFPEDSSSCSVHDLLLEEQGENPESSIPRSNFWRTHEGANLDLLSRRRRIKCR